MLTFFVIIPTLIAIFLFVFSGTKSARLIAIGFQAAFTGFATYLFLISRYSRYEDLVYTRVGEYDGLMGIFLRADNMAAVFVLMTAFIFLIITIFCLNEDHIRTYWFLLFLLEASLIGLFLTRDFFNAFVLVEVGTVLVTILLMYDRKRRNLYTGMVFIMINIVVMQFYLFAMGYIYMLTGVLDFEEAACRLAYLDPSQLAIPYALFMTAIAAKCSLLPILSWRPKVDAIPGARSSVAALMSGLHIKSGVYLFIRFQDVFGEFALQEFFIVIGVITGVVGVVGALAQTNIRLILAYSTIAQIGLIMIGLNMGTGAGYYAYYGSLFHIINHAVFKTALLLGAGMIIQRYKTQDITKIRGLFRVNKTIAISTLLAVLGIVGTPLFNGSVSKYFMMRDASGLLEWAMIIINLGTILICLKYCAMFFGKPAKAVAAVSTDWYKQSSTMVLSVVCLALGIFGEPFKNFAFNLDVHVDELSYLEKAGVFAASLAIALLLTKFVLKDYKILAPLRKLNISFKAMCVSLGAFFGLILIFTGI